MATIVYVTRDIERALGMAPSGDYHIAANKTPYAVEIQKAHPDNVLLFGDGSSLLDTYELLQLPELVDFLTKEKASVVVFKNTSAIEALCAEKKWKLLNPSAALAEKVENKITQVAWLGDAASFLPPHSISKIKDITSFDANTESAEPLIIQWAHSHTGDGTILVQNAKTLQMLKEKFPEREARVTHFIKGPMFTANIIVDDSPEILMGAISYQITGFLPFTENPFSTIGNDWSVTHTILTEKNVAQFLEIAKAVERKMKEAGWRGLFGIDCIYDEERDMMHLIEINARQPASTTFESQLELRIREHGIQGLTLFEAHLCALQKKTITGTLIEINDGAQIIQRVTPLTQSLSPESVTTKATALREIGYAVIEYANTTLNSDLLRIQSHRGLIETHTKLNTRGKEILKML